MDPKALSEAYDIINLMDKQLMVLEITGMLYILQE